MSAKISKALINVLQNIDELSGSTANKVYPIEAPNNVTLPYITLLRVSGLNDYTKDLIGYKSVNVQIEIQAGNYVDSADIAEIIETKLIGLKGNYKGVNIIQSRLIDESEDVVYDANSNKCNQQILIFNFKIQ